MNGSIVDKKSLAIGGVDPNNTADPKASGTPGQRCECDRFSIMIDLKSTYLDFCLYRETSTYHPTLRLLNQHLRRSRRTDAIELADNEMTHRELEHLDKSSVVEVASLSSFASLEKLLRPAVIQALGNALTPAKLGDAIFAPQAV